MLLLDPFGNSILEHLKTPSLMRRFGHGNISHGESWAARFCFLWTTFRCNARLKIKWRKEKSDLQGMSNFFNPKNFPRYRTLSDEGKVSGRKISFQMGLFNLFWWLQPFTQTAETGTLFPRGKSGASIASWTDSSRVFIQMDVPWEVQCNLTEFRNKKVGRPNRRTAGGQTDGKVDGQTDGQAKVTDGQTNGNFPLTRFSRRFETELHTSPIFIYHYISWSRISEEICYCWFDCFSLKMRRLVRFFSDIS